MAIQPPPSGQDVFSEFSGAQVLTYLFRLGGMNASTGLDAAYSLLQHCGDLPQVFQLDRSAVGAVPELTPEAGEYIALLTELTHRYVRPQPVNRPRMSTSEDVARLLARFFQTRKEETLYMLCLNPSWQLHAGGILSLGGGWQVRLPSRRMLDLALRHNTQGVILAHSHPPGAPDFSDSDIQCTWEMAQLLREVEVSLLDHILFVGDGTLSMRRRLEFPRKNSSPFSPMDRFPFK